MRIGRKLSGRPCESLFHLLSVCYNEAGRWTGRWAGRWTSFLKSLAGGLAGLHTSVSVGHAQGGYAGHLDPGAQNELKTLTRAWPEERERTLRPL